MEFLEGETLAERLREGPLAVEQLLRYANEICEGLEKGHKTGVIHRDLKPGNVMLSKTGAKLMDFGLAKTAPAEALHTSSLTMTLSGPLPAHPLTTQGAVLGTFQYMSPAACKSARQKKASASRTSHKTRVCLVRSGLR